MTENEYRAWVRQYAASIGLDPNLAESTWKQESGGGLDTSQKGPDLTRGRGNAIGPWQVVPYYHPNFPADGNPVEQGKYAMNYLKEVGPAGYYGRGQVMPGQPSTEEYVQQVQSRAAGLGNGQGGNSMESDSPLSNPSLLASLGILPQAQQPYVDRGPRNPFPSGGDPNSLNPIIAAIAGLAAGGTGDILGSLGNAGAAITEVDKNNMLTQKSMAEQWRLDEEMGIKREELHNARQRQAMSGVPPNIQEMLILKQMYPHMSDADLMSMAFAGRVPQGGTKVEKVGDRLFNVSYDQMGRPQYSPLSTEEQRSYESTIGSQEKIKKVGETFGKAQVDTLINTSGEYQKAYGALSHTEEILKKFESGEFDSATGPIAGRLGQYFNPETTRVVSEQMSATLANLGIENLAPVSEYELKLVSQMDVNAFNNKAQNIGVLKDLVKLRKAKADTLKRALTRLKTESFDEYLANPELIDFDTSGGGGAGGTGGWTIEQE